MVNIDAIEKEALAEIAEEDRREAVDRAKQHIRESRGRPWWQRLFPYRIRLERL